MTLFHSFNGCNTEIFIDQFVSLEKEAREDEVSPKDEPKDEVSPKDEPKDEASPILYES